MMIAILFLLQLPPEVQAAYDIRANYRTAHIVARDTDGSLYTMKTVGDTILVNKDVEADHYTEPSQEPGKLLVRDGVVFAKKPNTKYATKGRDVGYGVNTWGYDFFPDRDPWDGTGFFAETFEINECRSTSVGPLNYVTCAQSNGTSLEWALDTEKDSQPISVTLSKGGRPPHRAAYSTLENIDGHWIPTTVDYFDFDDVQTVIVEEASFDRAGQRQQEFDFDDLGIGVGFYILGIEDGYWDGAAVVSQKELTELLAFHNVPVHPEVIRIMARRRRVSAKDELRRWADAAEAYRLKHSEEYAAVLLKRQTRPKDEWDKYTEKFIKENKLNKPQQVVAAKILDRAKTLRDVYRDKQTVSSEQEEYDAIEKRIFDRMLVRNLNRLK